MHDSTVHAFLVSVLVLAYGLVSKVASRSVITAPMVFVVAGLLLSYGIGSVGIAPLRLGDGGGSFVHLLGEYTLIVLLFTDAARIDIVALRKEGWLPARLLGIGMPGTILAGAAAAWVLFPHFGIWELALLGVILAPTDAALGRAVVTSPRVPPRLRQTLSVESGLNDGIAVPLVVVFASLASIATPAVGAEAMPVADGIRFAAEQVVLGPLSGAAVGGLGALLIGASIRRGWISHDYLELAGIALAIVAALGAELIGGNAFIAAFVGGITFGNLSVKVSGLYDFAEAEGTLLMLLTFLLVGASLVPDTLESLSTPTLLYAVLSLTAVRMFPVLIGLIGVRSTVRTKLFLGWFGPRGLASVLFAVLVLEDEALAVAHADQISSIAIITVLLSVVLHGVSAAPGALWISRAQKASPCPLAQDDPSAMCYRTAHGGHGTGQSPPNGHT